MLEQRHPINGGHRYPTVLEPDLYPARTMLKKQVERETIPEVDQTSSELTDTFNVSPSSTPQRRGTVGHEGMSPSSPPECDHMLGQQFSREFIDASLTDKHTVSSIDAVESAGHVCPLLTEDQ